MTSATSSRSLRPLFALALSSCGALAACSSPEPATSDAGSDAAVVSEDDAGGQPDGGARRIGFRASEDFPTPIAFAQGVIRPFAGHRYLYVIGGASASGTTIGPFSSAVVRAEVIGDGTLGPWTPAGDIGDPGETYAIAGHDLIPLNGDDGSAGVALAGGGTTASALPFVLGGYVQEDGSLGHWGRFEPTLESGQSFGSFDAFEAHQLALIGGLAGATPLDLVRIAAIENGAMSPTWRPGPSLPEPRFGHASFSHEGEVFIVAGEGTDGPLTSILRTQRDATMEVTSWTSVGTIEAAPTFAAAFVHDGRVWVLGGLTGGRTGSPSARVVRADIGADGHIGTFSRVAGGDLPVALAASAVVYDNPYVYMVGGLTGDPVASSAHVLIGTLP